MKNLFFKIFFMNTFLPMIFSMAADLPLKTETKHLLKAVNVSAKFEDVVLTTDEFLQRFNPAGVEIKKKVVKGNTFEFLVVKKILAYVKNINLVGSLTIERTNEGCLPEESAYLGKIDFTGSDEFVVKNIESFSFLFCSTEKSKEAMVVKVKSKVYYKGKKLDFMFQKLAEDVLNEQVDALILAIKEEIASR